MQNEGVLLHRDKLSVTVQASLIFCIGVFGQTDNTTGSFLFIYYVGLLHGCWATRSDEPITDIFYEYLVDDASLINGASFSSFYPAVYMASG